MGLTIWWVFNPVMHRVHYSSQKFEINLNPFGCSTVFNYQVVNSQKLVFSFLKILSLHVFTISRWFIINTKKPTKGKMGVIVTFFTFIIWWWIVWFNSNNTHALNFDFSLIYSWLSEFPIPDPKKLTEWNRPPHTVKRLLLILQ